MTVSKARIVSAGFMALILSAAVASAAAPRVLPERKPSVPAAPPAPPTPPGEVATAPAAATRKDGLVLPSRKPPPTALTAKPTAAPRSAPIATAAFLSTAERDTFARAFRAAENRQWTEARRLAESLKKPALVKLVDWAFMREPGARATFNERVRFLTENPKWPGSNDLKRKAEDVIDNSTPPSDIAAWFSTSAPLTSDGRAAYARALSALGKTDEAHTVARDAWINGNFNRNEERNFLNDFGKILTAQDHTDRLEQLLYAGNTAAADRMLRRVDAQRVLVARARIALINSAHNVDGAVAQVPASLQNDPGLTYDRIKWRRKKGREADARALLPKNPDAAPRPDLWWNEREILARGTLAKGNITEAYTIIKNHGATDAVSLSEAEWLAGFIAMKFLKDGEAALVHFAKVYDTVQLPQNLSRAAYWTGRAAESLGRADIAAEWYRKAATHITTFYGQLALARLKDETLPQLPLDPVPSPEERVKFDYNELTQAIRALVDIGKTDHLRTFVLALADSSDFAVDRHMAAELAVRLGRTDLGVWVARQAARNGITLMKYGYPIPDYNYPRQPEKALILAIARQESNFDAAAVSHAGARGLMQLMPATARAVARGAGINYNQSNLNSDPATNLRIGAIYLDSLVEEFNGSYIMAAAGYNAGPGRPKRWARDVGDPRDSFDLALEWIEQIPFEETRNYVQRVMENTMVYRALLKDTTQVSQNLEQQLLRADR